MTARYRTPIEVRKQLFKRVGYKPSAEQEVMHFADVHDPSIRIKLVLGGERGGKSLSAAKEVVSRYHEGKLYWLAGETYEMCRKEMEYVLDDAQRAKGMLLDYSFPKQGECSCLLNAGRDKNGERRQVRVRTKSLKDLIQIGVESPDGIVICEAAQVSWLAVERCMSRVAESRGWLLLQGTMEGAINWFAERAREWQLYPNLESARVFSLPSWSNLVVFPGGREDPEIKRQEAQLPEDVFNERFGAIPCPPSLLVVRDFRNEVHVRDYEYNPDLPVEIAIDPGFQGAYAVEAVQWYSGVPHVFDELYYQNVITEDVITEVEKKPWSKNLKLAAIDVAAPAEAEVWQRRLGRLYIARQKVELDSGIIRLRSFLKPDISGKAGLTVHSRCKGLICEWGGGKGPDKVYGCGPWLRNKNSGQPMKRNDHASKALIYLLVNRTGYVTAEGGDAVPTFYWGLGERHESRLSRAYGAA